jgi:hypothetical protein
MLRPDIPGPGDVVSAGMADGSSVSYRMHLAYTTMPSGDVGVVWVDALGSSMEWKILPSTRPATGVVERLWRATEAIARVWWNVEVTSQGTWKSAWSLTVTRTGEGMDLREMEDWNQIIQDPRTSPMIILMVFPHLGHSSQMNGTTARLCAITGKEDGEDRSGDFGGLGADGSGSGSQLSSSSVSTSASHLVSGHVSTPGGNDGPSSQAPSPVISGTSLPPPLAYVEGQRLQREDEGHLHLFIPTSTSEQQRPMRTSDGVWVLPLLTATLIWQPSSHPEPDRTGEEEGIKGADGMVYEVHLISCTGDGKVRESMGAYFREALVQYRALSHLPSPGLSHPTNTFAPWIPVHIRILDRLASMLY